MVREGWRTQRSVQPESCRLLFPVEAIEFWTREDRNLKS